MTIANMITLELAITFFVILLAIMGTIKSLSSDDDP